MEGSLNPVRPILLSALAVLFTACSTTKVSRNHLPPRAEIRSVAVVDPVVQVVRKEVGREYLDTACVPALVENYHGGLQGTLDGMALHPMTIPEADRANFRGSLRRFFEEVATAKDLDSFEVSPNLLDLLRDAPGDYVIVTSLSGFDRSGGSMTLAMTGSILVGVLTLGMLMIIPSDSGLHMSSAILDRAHARVIYMDGVRVSGKPSKPKVMKSAQDKVFKTLNGKPAG
jgi:hypothetical protein